MIISAKSALKLIGITIVCFCAVFVCTFFLNFYLDILPLRSKVAEPMLPLYDAQLATAQMCCSVTGGVLALIAGVMVIFYVTLYVDEHSKELATLKALGYSAARLALSFAAFGLSALIGCALGYGLGHAIMPSVYEWLTIEGLTVEIHYHVSLLFALVIAPPILFGIVAYVCAYVKLKKPALEILKNKRKERKVKANVKLIKNKNSFLKEISIKTVSANKLLTFFVTFSCFCFSAMVQMGASMESLVNGTMGWMILAIGLVLAITSAFMALTSLVKNTSQSIAMMKTFGYSLGKCVASVFVGFIPFALLGFAVGTGYQYGLLYLMINLIFKDVGEIPNYTFNVGVMFITLAAFIMCYAAITAFYVAKINKVSVKEIMLEN